MFVKYHLTCVENAKEYVAHFTSDEEWSSAFPDVTRQSYLDEDMDWDEVAELIEEWDDYDIIHEIVKVKQGYDILYAELSEYGNQIYSIFKIILPEHLDRNNFSYYNKE